MKEFWRAIFIQIDYFKNGNYFTLKKIVEDSYKYSFPKDTMGRFLVFEVSRMLEISGIIEISDKSNQIRWSSNYIDDSVTHKIGDIFVGNNLLGKDAISFRFSDRKIDLIIPKKSLFNSGLLENDYINLISSVLPSVPNVIEACTSLRVWSEYIRDQEVELYEENTNSWKEYPTYLISEVSLIKRKLDNGQFEFIIVKPRDDSAQKIISPEWSFILLFKGKNKKLDSLFQAKSFSLNLPLRFPSIINKLFLLSSSEVKLDSGYQFSLVNDFGIGIFKKWYEGVDVNL